jgi:hypothetical protein
MPLNIKSASDFWIRIKGDPVAGTGDGLSGANAGAFEQWNREIGQLSDAAATSSTGSLSAISLLKGLLGQLIDAFSRPQTATVSNVSGDTTVSFSLIAASTTQKKRLIVNNLNGNLLLLFGTGTAAANNYSEILAPLSSLEFGPGDYFGEIKAIAPTATSGSIGITHWS